jgi:hypothetical protein
MSILTLKKKGQLGDGTPHSTLDLRAKVGSTTFSFSSFFFFISFAKCIKRKNQLVFLKMI